MTIIASYPNNTQAQLAYNKLLETGLDKEHISVASRQPETIPENMQGKNVSDVAADVTGGTTTGAVTGAAVGFLIGAAALAIPGFGALLISGPLAAAIGGSLAANTAVGAAIGGLGGFASGLMKAGVNEEDAKAIESNLQNGGVIIAVKDDAEGSHKTLLELTDPTSLIVFSD
jgi:uncharacterized membrane protein